MYGFMRRCWITFDASLPRSFPYHVPPYFHVALFRTANAAAFLTLHWRMGLTGRFLIVAVDGYEEHVWGRYMVVAYCRRMCEAEKCFWICTWASLTRRAGGMIKNARVAASGRPMAYKTLKIHIVLLMR
ncbi:hypothetical protein HBI59_009550 [Parastagonospora nodorum]|nr:hypothetical protein HBI59_009550 [Parastagonospora nodorum]